MLITHQQKLKIEKKVIEKKQFETDLCAAQQKTKKMRQTREITSSLNYQV